MRLMSLSLLAAGLGSLGLPLLASRVAHADDVLSRVPTVHITVAAVDSQAQLAGQLRAQGYTDVILSSTYPSPANPHPELNPTLTSHPEQTPVHSGWNGVASKDGRLVQVYVDR